MISADLPQHSFQYNRGWLGLSKVGHGDLSVVHLLAAPIHLWLGVQGRQALFVVDPTKHRRGGESGGCDLVRREMQKDSAQCCTFVSIGSDALISDFFAFCTIRS